MGWAIMFLVLIALVIILSISLINLGVCETPKAA